MKQNEVTIKKKLLSKREMQILELLAEGYRIKEASEKLGINNKTASTYILRIKTKTGIPTNKNLYYTITELQKKGIITLENNTNLKGSKSNNRFQEKMLEMMEKAEQQKKNKS